MSSNRDSFGSLAARAATASDNLQSARADARKSAISAIRAVEQALLASLDGEKLRGLPEIATRYRAARVRGKRIDLTLDHEHARGKEHLVIGEDGKLSMARYEKFGVTWRPVQDDELLIEDVEAVAGAARAVLERHLETVAKTTRRYEELRALSDRIKRLLS